MYEERAISLDAHKIEFNDGMICNLDFFKGDHLAALKAILLPLPSVVCSVTEGDFKRSGNKAPLIEVPMAGFPDETQQYFATRECAQMWEVGFAKEEWPKPFEYVPVLSTILKKDKLKESFKKYQTVEFMRLAIENTERQFGLDLSKPVFLES